MSAALTDQVAGVDDALDLLAELRAAPNLGAQEVPGGQVAHVEVLRHPARLEEDRETFRTVDRTCVRGGMSEMYRVFAFLHYATMREK